MQQYRNNRNNGNIYDLRKDLQHTPPPSHKKDLPAVRTGAMASTGNR